MTIIDSPIRLFNAKTFPGMQAIISETSAQQFSRLIHFSLVYVQAERYVIIFVKIKYIELSKSEMQHFLLAFENTDKKNSTPEL